METPTMHALARKLAVALLGLSLSLTAIAETELKKHYADDELIGILKDHGYRLVEKSEDRVLTLEVGGLTYVLYIYDDDDLQLYFGLTGYVVTPESVNEWNRTKRLARAYIDQVNDPVVESDLLANAGYTEQQLIEFVNVFDLVARDFRQFVAEHDESEE
jgi:hypothetical protein